MTEKLRRYVRETHESLCWQERIFILLLVLGIVADLVMVLWMKVESISWRTWVATKYHPTIMTGGGLLTIFVCWCVRRKWPLVAIGAYLGGHLFAHW